MVKRILVTGLDGSGKSTFFSNMGKIQKPSLAFINVPEINTQDFSDDSDLHKLTEFVNELGVIAHELQQPFVKGLTLFVAMVLYRDLEIHLERPPVQAIICERHPLIDTTIYAKFYAPKMVPEFFDEATLRLIDQTFPNELKAMLKRLGHVPVKYYPSLSGTLCHFIHYWFNEAKKGTVDQLHELFHVRAPQHIYYLEAAPEVLIARIHTRDRIEPHEKTSILKAFQQAYEEVFSYVSENHDCVITRINAAEIESLEAFKEHMAGQYNV